MPFRCSGCTQLKKIVSIVSLCGSLEIKPTISKFVCVGGMINVVK